MKRSSRACVRFVERKQANMKSSILIAAAIIAVAMPAATQTTTRSFYDGNGRFAGSRPRAATHVVITTDRARSRAAPSGTATRPTFYDGQGRYSGSSVGTSPRR